MYQIREHSSIDFLNYLKGVTLRDTHIRKEKKKQWALPWWSSAFTAGGMGLIPGRGTKIPHAKRRGQKKKKERKRRSKGWRGVLFTNKCVKWFPSFTVMGKEIIAAENDLAIIWR